MRTLQLSSQPVEILEAAAADSDSPRLKKFSMLAYSGQPFLQGWLGAPVILDLDTVSLHSQHLPILFDHDHRQIVGHTDAVKVSRKGVQLSGVISGVGPASQEIIALAANGFAWQASVGAASYDALDFVEKGASTKVNGKSVKGPVYIARGVKLGEVSFVAVGADGGTSVTVAASGGTMNFDNWLVARGFNGETLNADQRETLQLAYDTIHAQGNGDPVNEMRLKAAAEAARIGDVHRIAKNHPEIAAKAIADGWNATQVELEVLRASRAMPALHVHEPYHGVAPIRVLEAAICIAGRLPEKGFSDQELQAAHDRFRSRIGLQELINEGARLNGYSGPGVRHDGVGALRAAWSTAAIPGILSTVANKFLLEGYSHVEQSWRMIASTRPVSDFKTVTSYRLGANAQFEEVGPGGEIKHGDMDETSFTNRAKTYGKMFAITRQDIINDDLGALTQVPRQIGRGAGLKINDVFWTEFIANAATFWTTARGNYFEGATTNLQISSLATAVQYFRDQTDTGSKPLGIAPKLLLVPTALEVTAKNLFSGAAIIASSLGATNARVVEPAVNPHVGAYTPVVSAYLGNASYGNSSTAWYLLADPAELAVIEVVFLNGVENPTVESADADFSTLGIQARGYFDFGVSKQDYRGGVKSKGAA